MVDIMSNITMRPRKRSKVRLFLGKRYFTFKKFIGWLSGKKLCSCKDTIDNYPFIVFAHCTPLLRQLKNVDMWMQHNKVKNLEIAVSELDGIVLKPEEVFSYWKLIGKPTSRKGYLPGMQLDHGKLKAEIGGGLCQLSNLIYWVTLHTPLTVLERWRHSYDVFPDSDRKQPFGSGATCSYNYIDLQIQNYNSSPFLLHLYLTDTHLVGEWRSTVPFNDKYEVYEREHWISSEYWGGYVRHNIIARKIYNKSNELIKDEYITENHAIMMYEPLLGENSTM
jgi:vancomycin resistance protein VanW